MKSQIYSYSDLSEGMSREHEYVITPAIYEAFLSLSGDRSPLHTDSSYAQVCGFDGTLMHGAILNSFVSHFIGMVFPGGKSLELSVDIRFLKPAYVNDTVRVHGKIAQILDLHQVIVLHLTFVNSATSVTLASARVQVKMMTASPAL